MSGLAVMARNGSLLGNFPYTGPLDTALSRSIFLELSMPSLWSPRAVRKIDKDPEGCPILAARNRSPFYKSHDIVSIHSADPVLLTNCVPIHQMVSDLIYGGRRQWTARMMSCDAITIGSEVHDSNLG